jgi:hypothetical protein
MGVCVNANTAVASANEAVNISPTSSPRNGFAVIAGGARPCARLEGWPRVRALRPSFETLASQAPQDEVGDIFTTSNAGIIRCALSLGRTVQDLPSNERRWLWVHAFAETTTEDSIAKPPEPSLRGAQRRSNPSFFLLRDGLLRGACHRARIRATRWPAMTLIGSGYDFVLAARGARGVAFGFRP